MAVDPKTGKPVATPLDAGRAFAEHLADIEVIADAELDRALEDFLRSTTANQSPPPPDPAPRGVSPLRGACGPWLAAQEVLREGRP